MIFAVATWQVPLILLKSDEMVANSTLMTQLKTHINRTVGFLIDEFGDEAEPYDVLQLLEHSSDDIGEDYIADDLKKLLTASQIAELQAYLKRVLESEINDSMATIGDVVAVDEDPCDDPINVD